MGVLSFNIAPGCCAGMFEFLMEATSEEVCREVSTKCLLADDWKSSCGVLLKSCIPTLHLRIAQIKDYDRLHACRTRIEVRQVSRQLLRFLLSGLLFRPGFQWRFRFEVGDRREMASKVWPSGFGRSWG